MSDEKLLIIFDARAQREDGFRLHVYNTWRASL